MVQKQNYKYLPRIYPKSSLIGIERIHLKECSSTNEIAEEILRNGDFREGLVVTTDHQQAGKGQAGNSWVSSRGLDITCSVILQPGFLDIHDQFYLNIFTSLALGDLLTGFSSGSIRIKWPNDIILNGRKVAGILIKNFVTGSSIESTVIGIGLNVNSSPALDTATSLKDHANGDFDLTKVTKYLFEVLDNRYQYLKGGRKDELLSEYLQSLMWINEEHIFRTDHEFRGTIRGIDELGRLTVESDGQISSYSIKEIEYLK